MARVWPTVLITAPNFPKYRDDRLVGLKKVTAETPWQTLVGQASGAGQCATRLNAPALPLLFLCSWHVQLLLQLFFSCLEEERRLAYVGITRAKRTLAITLARKRKQYGELVECSPSRFLDELHPPIVCFPVESRTKPTNHSRQGAAHIARVGVSVHVFIVVGAAVGWGLGWGLLPFDNDSRIKN